jgi:hypothetical protein
VSYEVNPKECANVIALSSERRLQYFVSKVSDWEELWSIKDTEGWSLTATDDGTETVPVWPAREYAALMCIGNWAHGEPAVISLDDWLDKWLPGMGTDGRLVAIFPVPDSSCLVVSPQELRDWLTEYIEESYG